MLFATDKQVDKISVFIAASLALVSATAIAVVAGSLLSQFISERQLHYIAGTGFIVIGAWILLKV